MHAEIRSCLLFVPGNRPDRYQKAERAGADVVCFDLEDAVRMEDKGFAREQVVRHLADEKPLAGVARAVRINGLGTREGVRDLLALAESLVTVDMILLPKVRDAAEVRLMASILGESAPPVLVLVETASAAGNLASIATVATGGLLLGAADLAVELGTTPESAVLDPIRAALLVAAKGAGVELWESPWLSLHDDSGLSQAARRARAWGFVGMAAIHPAHVPFIQRAFAPTAEEIAEADRALAAYAAAGSRTLQFEGRLLEGPIIARYRRIREHANRSAAPAAQEESPS